MKKKQIYLQITSYLRLSGTEIETDLMHYLSSSDNLYKVNQSHV